MGEYTPVTKDDFRKYVGVQISGVTNMFDVVVVSELSGLTREQILYIMEHYGELSDRYPDIRVPGRCGH